MARRRDFRRAVPRRPVSWEGASFSSLALAGAATTLTMQSEANLESDREPTIVRVRGEIVWGLRVASAIPTNGLLTFGLMLLPTVTIGAAPSPFSDLGSDWLWWKSVPAQIGLGTLAAPTGPRNEVGTHGRFEVDNKSMRKVGVNMTLVLVVQATSITGIATFDFTGVFRFLVKT